MWRHMSVINAGTPAEKVCEGEAHGAITHHCGSFAGTASGACVYVHNEKSQQLVPSYCADETPENWAIWPDAGTTENENTVHAYNI